MTEEDNKLSEDLDIEVAESNWDRQDSYNVLIILLLIGSIGGLVYVGKQLITDGGKCVADPLEYYHSLGDDRCYCMSGYGAKDSDIYIKSRQEYVRNESNLINFSNVKIIK